MRYVVMTSSEKTALITYVRNNIKKVKYVSEIKSDSTKIYKNYTSWANFVFQAREDFQCAEIKNDLWILPLALKDNPAFAKVKEWILSKNPTIREVAQNEFIEYDIN